jgi:hypothetical protein
MMKAIQNQFYGDNPRWFIGVVEDNKNDPEQLGRVRVRIFGIHSPYLSDIAVEDLPWANVLIPSTGGGISGLGNSPTGLQQGAFVFGVFMDGEHSQMPFVLGTFSKYETDTGENIIPYKINIQYGGAAGGATSGESGSDPERPTIQDNYNKEASGLTYEQLATLQLAATESSTGFGLYNLSDIRAKGYYNFCSSNNYNVDDPRAQFLYIFEEYRKDGDLNYSNFKSSDTIRESIVSFYKDYLKKDLNEEELLTREIAAYELMDRFNES